MMRVCCCASPDCMANGCAIGRRDSVQQMGAYPGYFYQPAGHPLSVDIDALREMVREEIRRALKEKP